MITTIALLIATAVAAIVELWVCRSTKNGVKKFAKEVSAK